MNRGSGVCEMVAVAVSRWLSESLLRQQLADYGG